MSTPSTWVYHRLYVDAGFEAIEHLIVEVVPRVLEEGGFDRWFFLRFLDEDGLHLRLRVRATDDADALAERMRPLLEAGVEAADRAPAGDYRPTIVPPPELAAPYLRSLRGAGDRVVRTPYEPEVERFGTGLDTAERIFERSSRIALHVLAEERRGGPGRKVLAPPLMCEVALAFGVSRPEFWDEYAAYWLAPVPGLLERWRPRFVAKAGELARRGTSVLCNAPMLVEWRAALDEGAAAYRATAERRPRDLAFHFIHLMNNRLGLMPIEEAYFATLIGQAIAEEAA
jgi:hypothetical protein